MARFKVIYSYGKSPMNGTVMGQTHTYNNVVYHWKDKEELEFPDEKQAMDFYNKIINSWEKEEIYYKDRDSKKIHYNSVVVKAFKNGMWVPIKSANYKDWYDANKERKQKEYIEKNKQQPAGIVDNVMENKKNMKKQIKLKENELRKIVECKVRESLNEFYGMENDMFRKASDTDGIESSTQPQGQPANKQQANMEEDTKAQRKKDPLNQAFQDMEKAQKFRDTMDKIYSKDKKPLKESQFRKIVENKVRGVLKEMFEGEKTPTGMNDVKQEVENIVHEMGSEIEQWVTPNRFFDKHGCDGSIFNSEEDAKYAVLSGDDHQNAIDYVNTAQSPKEWVDYLVAGGVDREKAINIIRNNDWDSVINIIVNSDGPEWFLSGYSGQVHQLSNGQILYY